MYCIRIAFLGITTWLCEGNEGTHVRWYDAASQSPELCDGMINTNEGVINALYQLREEKKKKKACSLSLCLEAIIYRSDISNIALCICAFMFCNFFL